MVRLYQLLRRVANDNDSGVSDRVYQARILDAVYEAEKQIQDIVTRYQSALESGMKLIPTERRNLDEIY